LIRYIILSRIVLVWAQYLSVTGKFFAQEKVMTLHRLGSNVAGGVVYPGHRHFTQRLLSRRGFLEKTGLTAATLAAAGLLPAVARSAATTGAASTSHGRNSTTTATPLPIPGGLQLLGSTGPLFHVFLPATGAEPSTITNFNGFIGWAAVGGMGTHTVNGEAPEHLPFEADVRFMRGEFVGADGLNHHGAFAFI
jgi:hypothetical protein